RAQKTWVFAQNFVLAVAGAVNERLVHVLDTAIPAGNQYRVRVLFDRERKLAQPVVKILAFTHGLRQAVQGLLQLLPGRFYVLVRGMNRFRKQRLVKEQIGNDLVQMARQVVDIGNARTQREEV